ncbi:MAG: hypothetical protein Q6363_005755 [Candidatus Njordarchaeota archaeon]
MDPKKKILDEFFEKMKKEDIDIPPVYKANAYITAFLGGNPVRIIGDGINVVLTQKAEREYPKPKAPENLTPAEKLLMEMFWENTGAHFLDSGDIYGRWWQTNREYNDLRQKPEFWVEVDEDSDGLYFVFGLDTFHYLRKFLVLDETAIKLNKMFDEFAEQPENRDKSWLTVMEKFARFILDNWEDEPEFSEAWGPYNSYNDPDYCYLDQGIQYVVLNSGKAESYIILQVHNGCDIRGGYTKPRIFKIKGTGEYEYPIIDLIDHWGDLYFGCDCVYGHRRGIEVWIYRQEDGDELDESSRNGNGYPVFWRKEDKHTIICERCGKKVEFETYYP